MSKESKSTEDILAQLSRARKIIDESISALSGIKITTPKGGSSGTSSPKNSHDYINQICNKIKDCKESEQIETQILDKTSVDNRILLPLFICYRYFPSQRLTTGDIEKVTAELSVRVKTPNVAKAIAEKLWKYLDSSSTRTRGKVTLYKLNRKGEKYLAAVLKNNDDK